jgi:hypothetical protein
VSEIKISGSKDVFDLFQPFLGDIPYEEFWILLLNRANRVIDKIKISQGGISGTIIDPRIILKNAVDRLASTIILCHNHPSGNLNQAGIAGVNLHAQGYFTLCQGSQDTPDRLVRFGIGLLNRKRLREEHRGGIEELREHQRAFSGMLRRCPVAVDTAAANIQHYEVPPEFFTLVLGKRRKYSCCLYPPGVDTLDEAEERMLASNPS